MPVFIPPVINRIMPGQTAKQVATNFNAQVAAIEAHVNENVDRSMLIHAAFRCSATILIDSSLPVGADEGLVGVLQVPATNGPLVLDRFVLHVATYGLSAPSSTDAALMRIVVKKGTVARNIARFDWWREWDSHQANGGATIDMPLLPIDVRGARIEIWAFDNASASFVAPAVLWFRTALTSVPEEE